MLLTRSSGPCRRFPSRLLCGLLALGAAIFAQSWPASSVSASGPASATETRPNILVIVADDVGFSDIAPYGSEIRTPALSALADRGLRFSSYRTAPSCAPSRAMLLTGVDSHRAGVSNISEAIAPEQRASPFYNGHLNRNVVTIARLLNDSGYHTYLSGKWHLGYEDPALRPIHRGFERTVMMPFSGADNWSDKSYIPHYEKALWFENGEPLELPEDFYSSDYLVDRAIEQIAADHGDGRPFFSYLAFQAVHIPVQAPREYTERYLDTYTDGWTELRRRRAEAVRRLGLVAADAPMKTMSTTEDWDTLDEEEKRYNAKRMAVYAGMIESMDFNIGRLIRYLDEIGELDNTVIVFTSDNGPEPNDPAGMESLRGTAFRMFLRSSGYNTDYETLGEKDSYGTIGVSFASAAASPLGHYKFHSGDGGMRVPMIVSGPALAPEHVGAISHARAFVKDLAATILDLAGVAHPGIRYDGRYVEPMTGKSLLPVLSATSEGVYAGDDVIAYEIGANAALIKGDYKIITNRGPAGDGNWHLYNITADPGETRPLEKLEPAVFADLLAEYDRYTAENGVLPLPDDYSQLRQISRNAIRKQAIEPVIAILPPAPIAGPSIALLLVFAAVRRRRRRKEKRMKSMNRYGSTALVTGASSGIGKAFARSLAEQGIDVVLVARRAPLLEELAAELERDHGVKAHAIPQDLSRADAADELYTAIEAAGLRIDILINNAGYGSHGVFDTLDPARELEMINLSCRLPVALTHKVLGGMKQRGRGAIVFLSSVAGMMPVPFMATYSATKAFPLYFAEGLYGELSGSGIDVLAVAPGDTSTEFRDVADFHNKVPLPPRSAEHVVRTTFAALGRKPSVVDGIANKLTALSARITPKKLLLKQNAFIWRV